MTLKQEMETYERELPQLVQQEGKYVLIHDDSVVDVFQTYEDALKAGYKEFGLKPFLVKQISAIQQVHNFSRDMDVKCRI